MVSCFFFFSLKCSTTEMLTVELTIRSMAAMLSVDTSNAVSKLTAVSSAGCSVSVWMMIMMGESGKGHV